LPPVSFFQWSETPVTVAEQAMYELRLLTETENPGSVLDYTPVQRQASWGNGFLVTCGSLQLRCILNVKLLSKESFPYLCHLP